MVAEGALRGGRAGGEVNREQGEADRRRVGEHVSGVRQQRKASREEPADDIDEHVAQLHDHGERQGADARAAQLVHGLVAVAVAVVVVAAGVLGHRGRPGWSGFSCPGLGCGPPSDGGLGGHGLQLETSVQGEPHIPESPHGSVPVILTPLVEDHVQEGARDECLEDPGVQE